MSHAPAALESRAGKTANTGNPGTQGPAALAWLLPWALAVAGILITLALTN